VSEYVDGERETRPPILKKGHRQDKMEEIRGKYKIYIIKGFLFVSLQF
jgi:hypothetical protein